MAEIDRRLRKKRKIITILNALELLDSSSDEQSDDDIIPVLTAAVMSVR